MSEGIDIESKMLKSISFVVGILFAIVGIFNIIGAVGVGSSIFEMIYITSDFINGGILIFLGYMFLYGYKEMNEGKQEGFGFIVMGTFIAVALLIVYSLIMFADIAGYYLIESEDYEGWTLKDSLRLEMFITALEFLLVFPYILKNKIYIQR